MIELHRLLTDSLPDDADTRVSIAAEDIRQVHVGKGGITIITTPCGKLAVEEAYEDVVAMKERAAKDAF